MIHYLISHLERSTLNLNIRVGEWFSHQSAKLKREIFNEGSNPSTDSNFKFKNMAYIYCITNLINSKRYVGKTTTSIEERWKEHCYDFQKERCNKRPLYDAMNKYGVENFMIEELEYVDSNSELSEREIYWIKELGTYGSNGYNASKEEMALFYTIIVKLQNQLDWDILVLRYKKKQGTVKTLFTKF